MGRAEGGQGDMVGISLEISTREERETLLAELRTRPEISFAAIVRRSPRGALDLVIDVPEDYSLMTLSGQLEEALDYEVSASHYSDVAQSDLALTRLLDGQLLFDNKGIWEQLKAREGEVRERGTAAAVALAERAAAILGAS